MLSRMFHKQVYFKVDSKWLSGIIQDKYTGIIYKSIPIGYGGGQYSSGGIQDELVPINIDYYIIETDNIFHHILCSDIKGKKPDLKK